MHNPFYLVYFSILLLSFITGLACRKSMNNAFALILIQVILAVVAEILSQTLMIENNAILFNFYILAEVWLCGLALSVLLAGKLSRAFFRALATVTFIWLLNVYFAGIFHFANYAYLSAAILLGFACIITIIQKLQNGIFLFQSNAVAYLLVGLAAYYFCDLPLLSFLTSGKTGFISDPVMRNLFSINLLLAAVKYAFISFAFIQHKKEQTQKSSLS